MINIYIYIYISYIDSPKIGYIIIRGANETRQFASYSDSTRSKLGQNSTRARARLEMLTSQVELGSSKLESSRARLEMLTTRLELS